MALKKHDISMICPSIIARWKPENSLYTVYSLGISSQFSHTVQSLALIKILYFSLIIIFGNVFRIEELVLQLSSGGRELYLNAIKEVESKIEEERQAILSASQRCAVDADLLFKKGSAAPWTHEQLQLLIKAVNLFPAATNQRYVSKVVIYI